MAREEGARSGPHILKALYGVKEVFYGHNDADAQKLRLLQELIGEEDMGDEVTEVTISNLLHSTHS